MQSDPVTILLAHNQWASRQILEACEKLSAEQFHQKFEMGPGSLQNTVAHILGATRAWTQVMAGQTPTTRLDQDGQTRTPRELSGLLDSISADFAAESARLPLDHAVTRVRDGKTYVLTRGAVVMQVTTHAMHHRAQCLNMLRHLGVKPLPPSGVIEWTQMAKSV